MMKTTRIMQINENTVLVYSTVMNRICGMFHKNVKSTYMEISENFEELIDIFDRTSVRRVVADYAKLVDEYPVFSYTDGENTLVIEVDTIKKYFNIV